MQQEGQALLFLKMAISNIVAGKLGKDVPTISELVGALKEVLAGNRNDESVAIRILMQAMGDLLSGKMPPGVTVYDVLEQGCLEFNEEVRERQLARYGRC